MEKWIIEADIYRLHKQLRETVWPEERSRLLRILDHKQELLGQGGSALTNTAHANRHGR